jgi:hypothetical protein
MRVFVSPSCFLLCVLSAVASPKAGPFAEPSPVPTFFVPNGGQFSAEVQFAVETPNLRATFGSDGAVFRRGDSALRVHFVGARPGTIIEGTQAAVARANYFLGSDSARWQHDLPTFGGIVYRDLYPGIDASYSGVGRLLKSEFLVAAGADPAQIRVDYPGARSVSVVAEELKVDTGTAEFRELAPVVYQTGPDGRHITVQASWQVFADQTVGFALGAYDTTAPLIIDPVISYATYLGGSGTGTVTAIARDDLGNLYATGWTESLDFPISGALQSASRGGVDSFVVKFDPTGQTLLYATYLGGQSEDKAAAIAVDGLGQAYVAGATGSSNYPLWLATRSTFAGGREAFVTKLNTAGSRLIYSTFLGGSASDAATSVAVDSAGATYVAGDTGSANFGTLAAIQTTFGGRTDAFVVKLDPTGTRLSSTFLGGSQDEHAGAIAYYSNAVYVTGGTLSTNFPVLAATQTTNGGGQDAFLTKFEIGSTTSTLRFSTYLGGSGGNVTAPEQANAIAIHATGVYVAGVTSSSNFPVSTGSLQPGPGGGRDIFITKWNPATTARQYSTYLGWTGFDWASALAVDAGGSAYVAGYTSSVSFANVGGVQTSFRGIYDGFVAKLNPTGNGLPFSTLLGGTGADQINSIAIDASGNMFVGGQTASLDFPTANAFQSVNASGNTGWTARIGVTAPPTQVPSADSADLVYTSATTARLTLKYSHPAGATALTSVAMLLSRTASSDFACLVTYTRANNTLTLSNNVVSSGGTGIQPGSGQMENTQCKITGSGSSVSTAGNTLTMVLLVTLDTGFPGNTTVYLSAADANVGIGWVALPGISIVTLETVTPSDGAGASETFTFTIADTKSPSTLDTATLLINSSLSNVNGCVLVYHRPSGTVNLLWDEGTGSYGKKFGSSTNIYNSQCTLGVPTLTDTGKTISVTVPVTFKGSFTGPKNLYLSALVGSSSTGWTPIPWTQKGTYTVLAAGAPIAQEVSPSGGFGVGAPFTFVIAERGGSSSLHAAWMLFSRGTPSDLNNSCYLFWNRGANTVYLAKDTANAGWMGVGVGTTGSVSNSQCTLNGATVVVGPTTIAITVSIRFNASFVGVKNTYLYASAGPYKSGWATVGNWSVPGAAPTVLGVNPGSGTGSSATFNVSATTAENPSEANRISLLVTSSGVVNACYVEWLKSSGTIGLYNDGASAVSTKTLGSSQTLQNSQCSVGISTVSVSGNVTTLTVQIQFKPSFTGAKATFVSGANPYGSRSLQSTGTWTVP